MWTAVAVVPVSLQFASRFVPDTKTEKLNAQLNAWLIAQDEKLKGFMTQESFDVFLYQAALGHSIAVNPDGTILNATPSAAELFGYTQAEMRGMQIEKLMPPRYRGQHLAAFRRRFDGPVDNEKVVVVPKCDGLKKDGTEFPIEIRTKVIKTDSGLIGHARFTKADKIEVINSP